MDDTWGRGTKDARVVLLSPAEWGKRGAGGSDWGTHLAKSSGRDAKARALAPRHRNAAQSAGGQVFCDARGRVLPSKRAQGSWTDISAFEQGCRRGLALAKQDDPTGALRIYRAAERQYHGDLFEDLPIEYTHNDLEDWCRPRRRWLRQMALKLLRDMSSVLRSEGLVDEALEKCHRALSIDMANESTNMETMRVLHAQGRFDAIDRQYEQFLSASDQRGSDVEDTAFYKLYKRLSS